jgi:hypothetical protein
MLLTNKKATAQEFGGGIIAGLTVTQVSGDNLGGFDKLGIYSGFYTYLSISEQWRFQMELYYINKGSRDGSDDGGNFYRLNLQTVEMPLLFQYNYSESVYFDFGPALSILANSSESDIAGMLEQEFYPLSVTGIAGVGYRFNYNISFSVRGQWSLSRLRPLNTGNVNLPTYDRLFGGWRSLALTFGLAYGF